MGDGLDATVVTTFYDSVCGKPLFRAPVGRTFQAWRTESEHHGWPSFRPEETVSENIIIHPGGEMSSTCGTHLGHNLPDRTGARYCIDLVCMAGAAPVTIKPEGPAPSLPAIRPTTTPSTPISVYFGAGCYWHTQYDMYLVESAAPFSRSGADITAHVGYAGGFAEGPGGLVCYHGGPRGTLYSDMGHGEATEVMLDSDQATAQFEKLVEKYFEEFRKVGSTWSRLDPQDWGLAYRCLVGIPGGVNGDLYPILQRLNVGLNLVEGRGQGDTLDENTIYVYDTATYPFYRGEQYHQFHSNSVLRRTVPSSYLVDVKTAQVAHGKIDPTGCPDQPMSGVTRLPPAPPPLAPATAPSIAGRYAGSITQMGQTQAVTVEIADDCDVGAVCGSTSYKWTGTDARQNTCTGELSLVSADLIIFNMRERIVSGDCSPAVSIAVGRASGGLGFRTAFGSALLHASTDLMVSGGSCESSLTVFAQRLDTVCLFVCACCCTQGRGPMTALD